jgi:hypothetical protein
LIHWISNQLGLIALPMLSDHSDWVETVAKSMRRQPENLNRGLDVILRQRESALNLPNYLKQAAVDVTIVPRTTKHLGIAGGAEEGSIKLCHPLVIICREG